MAELADNDFMYRKIYDVVLVLAFSTHISIHTHTHTQSDCEAWYAASKLVKLYCCAMQGEVVYIAHSLL